MQRVEFENDRKEDASSKQVPVIDIDEDEVSF
jgi:hypothetical protein